MGRVKVSIATKAPLDIMYKIAHIVEDYPKHIPALKKIRLIERSPDGKFTRAEWHAGTGFLGSSRTLVWVQDDNWDDENNLCRVSLHQSGQMKELSGELRFKERGAGSEVTFDVDFKVDHPLMNPTIHRLLDQLMKKNNEAMLLSLKRRAEKQFWEEW